MKSEYSKWFWSECDELNKDTSFAHSLAEKAWNYRQTEVNELTLQVAEMKSRLNDAYTDGQSAMYAARQSKVDELQKRVDAATAKWISIISILTTTESNVPDVIYQQLDELHDALCGYELEQALKGGNHEAN